MKRARVTSVYEGKERNRSRKGEEARRDQSKHARMTAKARISVQKESMKKPLSLKHKKPLVVMKSKEETLQNIMEKDHKGVVENNMEEEMEIANSKLVEDWPEMLLTYEEEWTWFAFAFGWGWWQRYDAVMMN
ncbi:hypothetical protein CARUB_v10007005mg [Capsella rubella]|uniref:Uncharacterized protein n=1 Tax=Capsella rubella TaxID=81985 RepID=R0F292_9BRAS|nr:uncharacterized protein LOC17879898 [Capsella rubella]EOA15777.1 hypothetical protein CARUB_v10007005mg [Capsella rubella]